MAALIVPVTLSAINPEIPVNLAALNESVPARLDAAYQMGETYDGPLTVVPSSAQQLLATAGKLMPGDVTVSPALWNWMGQDTELVDTIYQASFALADTSYATWSPSTTAKAIRAAATAGTFTANMATYSYLLRWRFQFQAAYQIGTTRKAAVETEIAELWQGIFRRPNSLSALAGSSFVGNTCATLFTAPLMIYYNSSGSQAYTYSASYGVYPSATAATFSDATSDNPTVTVKTPSVNARCSSTYFSTAMADAINGSKSIVIIKGELYRMKPGSTIRGIFEGLVDLLNHPL